MHNVNITMHFEERKADNTSIEQPMIRQDSHARRLSEFRISS